MLDEKSFRELFYEAILIHRRDHKVGDDRIVKAIAAIQKEYAPRKWGSSPDSKPPNFDDPAYRCAYLHKHASFHAALIYNLATQNIGPSVFRNLFADVSTANVCCIGGGAGTDIIGLCALFGTMPELRSKVFHFDVVDCMVEWRSAFASILEASFKYENFSTFLTSCITSSYLQADVLSCITEPVRDSICSADLVTMIKFVSSAVSKATPQMLKNVFSLMKPGAAILFIDYAGGEFYELVSNASQRCKLTNLSGPFRHVKYENDAFRRKMFGSFGVCSTTVAVQMWRKTLPITLFVYESQKSSKEMLDDRASNLSSSHLRNSKGSIYGKKVKKRRRNPKKSESVCGTKESSSTNFVRLNKSSSGLNDSLTIITSTTISSAHSQMPVLKENIGSSFASQPGKSPSDIDSSLRKRHTRAAKCNTGIVKMTTGPSASMHLKPSAPPEIIQHDQNTLSGLVPKEVNVCFVCAKSNVCSSHANNGFEISANQMYCSKHASNITTDFGMVQNFSESKVCSCEYIKYSDSSHRSRCKNQNEKSTDCCVIL